MPQGTSNAVTITDVNGARRDRSIQRNGVVSNHFKGPLSPEGTHRHIVRAYIDRQMEKIKTHLYQTDTRNDDVIDCLLIWELLDRVVQQHGKVTGPDIAELLVRSCPTLREPGHGGEVGGANLENAPPTTPDPMAYKTYTHFITKGLIDDAINFAIDEGLFLDVLILARKLSPHRLEEIEEKYLATRPPSDPVKTLLAVAGDRGDSCLSKMVPEERGGWKRHAAPIFANLKSHHAMEKIRKLGEELARRECNAAADFCFLAVALLAGADVFTPTIDPITVLNPTLRRHIELIHARNPSDETESTHCEYGFSLTDLHATEIFDYGFRLSG
ncbi:hypothetical protein PFISCL1PPCAC_27764, partial [Pristionchus fissidentatus]